MFEKLSSCIARISWRHLRAILFAVLVLSGTSLVGLAIANTGQESSEEVDTRDTITRPLDGLTAITTQGQDPTGESGQLVLANEGGYIIYRLTEWDYYWDVDPSPEGSHTLQFTASNHYKGENCPDGMQKCTHDAIIHHNVSTGESTIVYEHTYESHYMVKWHDVDRVGRSEYLIANIGNNSLDRLDAESGEITRLWHASDTYEHEDGGEYPKDWAHLNDVENLDDGRMMISPRNMDSVLFLHENGTVQDSWTIGSDDDHSTLYEAHNPDYLNESQGGPAVIVADSENDRIVEFQRQDGEWVESWVWSDSNMSWPRDADRLPSGQTLITDTHADRVILVDKVGEISWSRSIPMPYEAERLGTGDESAGGGSAQSLGLGSSEVDSTAAKHRPVKQVRLTILDALPPKLVHGLDYSLPGWMTLWDFLLLFAWASSTVAFLIGELTFRVKTRYRTGGGPSV